MRRYYLVLLILWVHCGDLFTAWLYGGGAFPAASLLRPSRDASVIAVAALCLLTVRMPATLLAPILIYGLLALLYLPAGWNHGLPPSVLLGSFGTLMIPMLFFLVGYYCMRTTHEFRAAVKLIVLLGIASTLFGMWDVRHTEFWTETIRFPDYMAQIKGVLPAGTHPETRLPWNYYGGAFIDLQRRAGGLLAAPLAQGLFLAVAGILAIALLQRRPDRTGHTWLGFAVCALLFSGVWVSGTRGAMLAGSIALLGYLATCRELSRGPGLRLLLAGAALVVVGLASQRIVLMTIRFLDGSTIGHWTALQRNLEDLPRVLLLGGGLGRQGPAAGTLGLSDLGGGEGAIFSIAFQMGVPAALLFLFFYAQSMRLAWRAYQQLREPLGLALFWLAAGMTVTLVTSEHILSVSGSAGFWLLLGGLLRATGHSRRAPARMQAWDTLEGRIR